MAVPVNVGGIVASVVGNLIQVVATDAVPLGEVLVVVLAFRFVMGAIGEALGVPGGGFGASKPDAERIGFPQTNQVTEDEALPGWQAWE